MTRCAVRAVTGFCGINPPANELDLMVDQDVVRVGSVVTGMVQVIGDYAHDVSVTVVLEGIQYCVVALSTRQLEEYGDVGKEYLKKHTSEQKTFLSNKVTLHNAEHPTAFRFSLPETVPGSLRCVLDGTNPLLPSQCQIKYTITATIANHTASAKRQVSYPVVVLPKKEAEIPLDPTLTVSVGSPMEVLYGKFFSCGSNDSVFSCSSSKARPPDVIPASSSSSCSEDILSDEYDLGYDDDLDYENREPNIMIKTMLSKPHCILDSSHTKLNLSAGQTLDVFVKDWFRQLKPGTWMIRFVEELSWISQGRRARSQQSWDLYANHHELPTTLRKSFNSSLISVKHELIVYLTTKDTNKDILAMTEPIQVSIVTNQRGWDA